MIFLYKKNFLISSSHSIQSGAPSIPYDGLTSLDTDLNVWQRRATELVQPKIDGDSGLSHDPYLLRLWAPAPPKMYIHPRRVKEHLFGEYTSTHTAQTYDDEEEDEDLSFSDERKSVFTNFSEQEPLIDSTLIVPVIRPYKSLENLPSSSDHGDEFQMIPTMIRSVRSCSNLIAASVIRFDTNYAFTLDETKHQIEARKTSKAELAKSIPISSDEAQQVMSTESVEMNDIKRRASKNINSIFFN